MTKLYVLYSGFQPRMKHTLLVQVSEQYTVGISTSLELNSYISRHDRCDERGIVYAVDGTAYVGVGRVFVSDMGEFETLGIGTLGDCEACGLDEDGFGFLAARIVGYRTRLNLPRSRNVRFPQYHLSVLQLIPP